MTHIRIFILVVIYILSGVVGKTVSMSPGSIVLGRLLVAVLIVSPWIWRGRWWRVLERRSLIICLIQAASGYILGGWAFNQALKTSSLGEVAFIGGLPMMALIDLAIRKGRGVSAEILPLGLSIIGAVIFFGINPLNISKGAFWALLCGIFVAISQYGRRFHSAGTPSTVIADGVLSFALLLAVIFFAPTFEMPHGNDRSWIIFGGVLYFLGNRFTSRIMIESTPLMISLVLATEPCWALIADSVWFGDAIAQHHIVGSLVLLLACLKHWPLFVENEMRRMLNRTKRFKAQQESRCGI